MKTIQQARLEKGLTQCQLATYANVAISTVSTIERGYPTTMHTLKALCKILECEPKDIDIVIKQRTGKTGWTVVEDPFTVTS